MQPHFLHLMRATALRCPQFHCRCMQSTALPGIQAAARQAGVPADSLAFECDVLNSEVPLEAAPSGVYIKVTDGPRMLHDQRHTGSANMRLWTLQRGRNCLLKVQGDMPSSNRHAQTDAAGVQGLFLEGACWDAAAGCLSEPRALQLATQLPVLHLRPAAARRRPHRGTYVCPLYATRARARVAEQAGFVTSVPLRDGGVPADHWVLRGTALLLSLGD